MVRVLALLAVLAFSGSMGEDVSFTLDDLNKEMGYFGRCKGKKINYPSDAVTKGMAEVPGCIAMVSSQLGAVHMNKNCIAHCVVDRMGYVNDDGTYNWTNAVAPLEATVTGQPGGNDRDVIEIQKEVIRRCAGTDDKPPKRYVWKEDCKDAKRFEICVKEGAVKDCGNEERRDDEGEKEAT